MCILSKNVEQVQTWSEVGCFFLLSGIFTLFIQKKNISGLPNFYPYILLSHQVTARVNNNLDDNRTVFFIIPRIQPHSIKTIWLLFNRLLEMLESSIKNAWKLHNNNNIRHVAFWCSQLYALSTCVFKLSLQQIKLAKHLHCELLHHHRTMFVIFAYMYFK